jgi:uncharacterized protein
MAAPNSTASLSSTNMEKDSYVQPTHSHDSGRHTSHAPATLQPGQWRPYEHRKFGNPAPLGLSAFALTTFVLGLINMGARGEEHPHIIVTLALGYGGLVQLLAGMW